MKITLAQAINLLSSLHKKASELHSEFFNVYVMEIPKGETYTPYERTVEAVLRELPKFSKILDLKEIIQQANLSNLVEWDGSSISMVRAIETAKQLRKDSICSKPLPLLKNESTKYSIIQVPSWNKSLSLTPAEYKKQARQTIPAS